MTTERKPETMAEAWETHVAPLVARFTDWGMDHPWRAAGLLGALSLSAYIVAYSIKALLG